ncbi:MAG: type II toxin-antitoxin system RelE/ParE family toxin [Methylobacter sp.]|nr:type II toxin-antitoxin system RelE/ParE family toxin [Methylobacter sp.]
MIIWSKPASEDLRLIHQYIAHDSKHYATRVIQDITNKVGILMSLPRLGKVVSEIGEQSVREIAMYSYRIMYELIGDTIYIHGIFHKRRHFKPEDLQR